MNEERDDVTTGGPATPESAAPIPDRSGDAEAHSPESAPAPAPNETGSRDAAPEGEAGPAPEKRKKRRRRRKKKPQGDAPDGAPAAVARQAPKAPRGGKRERSRPRPGPGRGKPSQHHASIAVRELAAMARTLLDAEGVDLLGRPRYLPVEVRVPLDPERDGGSASAGVVEQILRRVREVREHEQALSPGSVYCYFHASAQAPTARPQGPREVFDGYSSTGRPVFTDFVTMAIERRDEGIDQLVNGEDIIVTHVSMGRVLRTQQLVEFGQTSPVYRILGQVDAGLYPLLGSPDKAAFSFQLLRGTTLEGRTRFRLHWVGAADVRDVADPGVVRLLQQFQRKLDHESLRFAGLSANGTPPDEEEFVLPILQDLARSLRGRARRAGRRTGHATQRSEEGQRPTTKAWEDARDAGDDRVLRDIQEDTFVVVGPKNRVHVFAPDARHVTSFVMSGGNVQRRRQEGRWQPAEPEERGEFRIALKQRLERDQGDEEPADVAAPTPPAE